MAGSVLGLSLKLKCLFTGMCFDAAEILDEVGAVCNSTGWQLKGILSHKPVSSGKQFFIFIILRECDLQVFNSSYSRLRCVL